MKPPFVRTAYNYDTNQASTESGLECKDHSLTKQSFADEADINTIVRRFNLTGQLPQDVRPPQYADFEEVYDYHSALNVIAAAHEAFDAMPAETRARFQNDPGEFVDFCNNPENVDEMIKMGLAVPVHKEPVIPKTESPSAGVANEGDSKPA